MARRTRARLFPGHSHANKPKSWVFHRYFGKFNKARQDRWVFGDRISGAYMHRFAWTTIVRHPIVKQGASPDDPTLAEYWAWRRRKAPMPINNTTLQLYRAQDGRCPVCKAALLTVDQRPQTPHQWEQWLTTIRPTITIAETRTASTDEAEYRLTHTRCHQCSDPALLPANKPTGLA